MAAVADNAVGSGDQFLRRSPAPEASEGPESEYQRDVRHLVDLLSKLNPSAKEFFPSSAAAAAAAGPKSGARLSANAPVFVVSNDYYLHNDSSSDGSFYNQSYRGRKNGYNNGRRRMNGRGRRAEREDSIRRTVYVSDLDHQVTEEKLAEVFASCGQVLDCRICGDTHSVLRFAFIEFSDEDSARAALNLGGTMLGFYPVRVLPSKTAILPVNPRFLPRSEDEKEMVVRTVYCTNIDKKVTQADIKGFFEHYCGEVSRLRLLGDNVHSTRIAFVEFFQAESAILALDCSGMVLGSLPIRVSPSKTPVKPRLPRASLN